MLNVQYLDTTSDLVEQFLDYCQTETKRAFYKHVLLELFGVPEVQFIHYELACSVNEDDFYNYFKKCSKSNNLKTIEYKRNALGHFYKYFGIIVGQRWERIFGSERILITKEINDLMSKAENKHKIKMLILILLNLGLEIEEVRSIRWNDFIFFDEKWYANIHGVKPRKLLVVKVNFIDSLEDYAANTNKKLGVSTHKIFKALGSIPVILSQYGVNVQMLINTARDRGNIDIV